MGNTDPLPAQPVRKRLAMADSNDTPPSKPAGLGRILSRRQVMAEASAPGAPAHKATAHGHGTTPLQRIFSHAHSPDALLHAFAQGMSSLPGELGDLGRLLHSACDRQEWERYGRLLRQLIDKYIRTIELEPAPGGNSEAERLRDMLRNTLGAVLSSLLQQAPELEAQARRMGDELHGWQSGQSLEPVEQHLRELCHQVGVRNDVLHEQHDLLLNLFDLLLQNIAELVDGGSWLHGQIGNVRQVLAGPLDRTSLERTRNDLRAVIYRQGVLRQGIEESKEAMKELMVDFVEQVEGMASETGDYHDRIASYAVAVRQARSLADLGQLLQNVLQDTARVQAQALRARDRLASARAEALAAEQRVQQLERELEEAGSQLRTDPLTGAMNRRGLQELLADARSRCSASPCWTWTISARPTPTMATPAATMHCATWWPPRRRGWAARARSHAWAVTSSCWSCPAWPRSRPTRSCAGCRKRWPIARSCTTASACTCASAPASRNGVPTNRPRPSCSGPTARSTPPSRPAATGSATPTEPATGIDRGRAAPSMRPGRPAGPPRHPPT